MLWLFFLFACYSTDKRIDWDGDGFTVEEGDCDDQSFILSPADLDGDGISTCDGDCDDTSFVLSLSDSDGDGQTGCGGDFV